MVQQDNLIYPNFSNNMQNYIKPKQRARTAMGQRVESAKVMERNDNMNIIYAGNNESYLDVFNDTIYLSKRRAAD